MRWSHKPLEFREDVYPPQTWSTPWNPAWKSGDRLVGAIAIAVMAATWAITSIIANPHGFALWVASLVV